MVRPAYRFFGRRQAFQRTESLRGASLRMTPFAGSVSPLFLRIRYKGVLTDAEVKPVEDALLASLRAGVVMAEHGRRAKVRAAQEQRGKSGSARVAYLYVQEQATVYFILAFPKNVQGNLTEAQKKQVRALVAQIRREERPRKGPGTGGEQRPRS
jgi:hypothetical protein